MERSGIFREKQTMTVMLWIMVIMVIILILNEAMRERYSLGALLAFSAPFLMILLWDLLVKIKNPKRIEIGAEGIKYWTRSSLGFGGKKAFYPWNDYRRVYIDWCETTERGRLDHMYLVLEAHDGSEAYVFFDNLHKRRQRIIGALTAYCGDCVFDRELSERNRRKHFRFIRNEIALIAVSVAIAALIGHYLS